MGTRLFWQLATEQLNIHICILSGWKQSFFIRKSNFIRALIFFQYNAQTPWGFLTGALPRQNEWINRDAESTNDSGVWLFTY